MKPNEFKDQSRYRLPLGGPAVCRCMGSRVGGCILFFFVIYVALSKFSSALHQCVWRRPKPRVTWLAGQIVAITCLLFRGYNPEQLWHPWTLLCQDSLILFLPLILCFFSLPHSIILVFIYPLKSLSFSVFGLLVTLVEELIVLISAYTELLCV